MPVVASALFSSAVFVSSAFAYDISERLSIDGLLAGAIQCQSLSGAPEFDNTCDTVVPFQLMGDYQPNKSNQFFIKLGFAGNDGLNEKSPFIIAPWAADLKDSVSNVNSHSSEHLLTAWYKHTKTFNKKHEVSFSLGIVDATDYLDNNVYANDEFTQFMNAALTNAPNVFLPSFDTGAALEWSKGNWSLHGIAMDIGKKDDTAQFVFYGLQASYSANNSMGSGNYRIIITKGNDKSQEQAGTKVKNGNGVLLSMDQEFGKLVGGWARIAAQTDGREINYKTIYSAGIDLKGIGWGRANDNIGFGLAILSDGNLEIDRTQIVESYYRWQLSVAFGLTADIQYLSDQYHTGENPSGMIYSLRAVANF